MTSCDNHETLTSFTSTKTEKNNEETKMSDLSYLQKLGQRPSFAERKTTGSRGVVSPPPQTVSRNQYGVQSMVNRIYKLQSKEDISEPLYKGWGQGKPPLT